MRSPYLDGILDKATVKYFEDHPEFGHHVYATATDELYTGCTTVANYHDISDFLAPWYAKEAVKALGWYDQYDKGKKVPKEKLAELKLLFEQKFEELKKMSSGDYYDLLTKAKGAAKEIGAQAGTDGTKAHDWLESYVSHEIDANIGVDTIPDNEAPKNAISAFLRWIPSQNIDWLASEETINSNVHRIGGRLDALGNYNHLPTLIDFKTSGQISAAYLLQLAGYSIMLDEMGFPVRQWLIIRVPKDGADVDTLTVNNLKNMEFYRKTFLHQREALKFYSYVESTLKDKNTGKLKIDIPNIKVEK